MAGEFYVFQISPKAEIQSLTTARQSPQGSGPEVLGITLEQK